LPKIRAILAFIISKDLVTRTPISAIIRFLYVLIAYRAGAAGFIGKIELLIIWAFMNTLASFILFPGAVAYAGLYGNVPRLIYFTI